MTRHELREAIATEAARLILRGKAPEFHSARIRASRWVSKRKLSADQMPTNAEIQQKLQELACLFTDAQNPWSDQNGRPSDSDAGEELGDETNEPLDEDQYHPDTFPMLALLMNRLDGVRLDTAQHPEGDALYHSLQVYELGLIERPWDEEFLLACLIHDIGLAIDRRRPIEAALEAVGPLLTERTRFLIENRPAGSEYIRTGRIARTFRRSPHFDDLVLLARCDQKGRVPGAEVGTLEEALEYIAGLEESWDDA